VGKGDPLQLDLNLKKCFSNSLFCNPLFWVGLVIKLLLIFIIVPTPVIEWYAPFLDVSTQGFSLDPWSTWLMQGGSSSAFPYGYVMWFAFLPTVLVCKGLGISLTYAYGVTLLLIDFLLLLLFKNMLPQRDKLLLAVYWLSPIVIVATYLYGFNDLIPVFLLSFSLLLIKRHHIMGAAFLCCAAVSAKLSMVLAIPFFFIYLFNNKALRAFFIPFLYNMTAGAVIFFAPFFLFSRGGVEMLFNNPEISKIYRFSIPLAESSAIYLVPLIYLLVLYGAWRVKRPNFGLFHAVLGMAFLLVVLMTPASPGWFIWAIPLLVTYQATSDRIAIGLSTVFSVLYVLSTLLLIPDDSALAMVLFSDDIQALRIDNMVASLMHTSMVATGIVLAVRIWRETVSRNDYFRLSRKPFVLGIAGDSGAGKDTLADALKGLFGDHSVATVSGDDYHLWDRQKPMWQVMTHLNPMANDLEGFTHDLVALTDGKCIHSRHYDHTTGRMSRPFRIASNDIIIASGLHALYLPILRRCYNLSIYLDIDEGLRRYFKIQRDVHKRGHTREKVLNSFQKREPDAARFIRPQSSYADLVLSLQPIHPQMIEEGESTRPLRFKVVARSRHGLNELSLARVLVGVCGLHVDMVSNEDASEV
jgi:uridine kinase